MANVVTYYNAKGGQGKTTLAVLYALFSNSHYYTNDYKSGTEDLFKDVLTSERFHIITPQDKNVDIADKAVIDLGGFIDGKVPAILKASDLCVIPIFYQSKADLIAFFNVSTAITKWNQNLLFIINNSPQREADELLGIFRTGFEGRFPIRVVKHSTYMGYLANTGKTPFDLVETGVAAKALGVIQEQLKELFKFIENYQRDPIIGYDWQNPQTSNPGN